MRRLRTLVGALIWLAVIVVIAFGAAGIVAGTDHPPGSDGRPDATAAGDAEVTPMLDAANADLSALAGQVEALSTQARGALAALNSADPTTGEAAIAEGDKLVADVIARTAALRRELSAVPYVGTPVAGLHVSDAIVQRHDRLVAALDATQGLDFAWARLTIGAVAATKMSALLAKHDSLVGQAADSGVHAKYAAALKLLGQATAQLDAARVIRDQLVDDRRRLGPRRMGQPQRRLRHGARQPVQGDLQGQGQGHRQPPAPRSRRKPRPALGSHRTPGASSSSWPTSAAAG